MKINLPQLTPLLRQSISPVYIISGDEPYQKDEAILLIRQSALKAGFSERVRIIPEAGFDIAVLHNAFFATSLLSEKRLIELDLRDTTPSKAISTLLQEYANQAMPDIVLLININKLDDKITKSAWYNALEKIGVVITIWPISREQLPKWIMQKAQQYALAIKPDAAALLAGSVEGNLVAASQTLEKMALLDLKRPIDSDVLQRILTNESQFNVFDLVDSLLINNPGRSLMILEQLRQHDTEPAIVLWGITRELRLLAECAEVMAQNKPLDLAFKKHRVFPRRQPVIKSYLAHTSARQCYQHLSQAIHVDLAIKGGSHDDPWQVLEHFCLRLTCR